MRAQAPKPHCFFWCRGQHHSCSTCAEAGEDAAKDFLVRKSRTHQQLDATCIVEENPKTGAKTITKNRCGTPQGGVISPLLSNLYLDGLDKAVNGGKKMKAIMVRFADDAMCLCRKGKGEQMYQALKRWLEQHGLKLNEEKTRIVNSQRESLEFLRFRLSRRKFWKGKEYTHVEPNPKSCNKLCEAIRQETTKSTLWRKPEEVFLRVNQREIFFLLRELNKDLFNCSLNYEKQPPSFYRYCCCCFS